MGDLALKQSSVARSPREELSIGPTSFQSTSKICFASGEAESGRRAVPVEVPVQIVFGGIPFAVMMMTPCDLEDFAFGFSLTEGIVGSSRDVREVRSTQQGEAAELSIDVAPACLHALLARRRATSGRTSCGICGIPDIASLRRAPSATLPTPRIALQAIHRALGELQDRQILNQSTHAMHAAGWADFDGRIVLVREDVGRHNALDKLIGALLRRQEDAAGGFFIITSRCSFEMVEKIAAFGGRVLIAISAPTSLALERARDHDITVAGIARTDSITVFHGVERIVT
jgi:FdhD protein